jgi:hypothetical protein
MRRSEEREIATAILRSRGAGRRRKRRPERGERSMNLDNVCALVYAGVEYGSAIRDRDSFARIEAENDHFIRIVEHEELVEWVKDTVLAYDGALTKRQQYVVRKVIADAMRLQNEYDYWAKAKTKATAASSEDAIGSAV